MNSINNINDKKENSDVKPFCLVFNTIPLLILPSIMEEKIRPKIGLMVIGRQFST